MSYRNGKWHELGKKNKKKRASAGTAAASSCCTDQDGSEVLREQPRMVDPSSPVGCMCDWPSIEDKSGTNPWWHCRSWPGVSVVWCWPCEVGRRWLCRSKQVVHWRRCSRLHNSRLRVWFPHPAETASIAPSGLPCSRLRNVDRIQRKPWKCLEMSMRVQQ